MIARDCGVLINLRDFEVRHSEVEHLLLRAEVLLYT